MRRKKAQIRGEKLVLVIKGELGRMVGLSPKECPITISSVAKRLKISRQTLYSHDLKKVVEEFASIQRENFDEVDEASIKRRSLEERLKALEQENNVLSEKLDSYIERWVAIEYNSRMLGIDPDELFVSAPKPLRSIVRK